MDLDEVIADLRAEREVIEQAIVVLERLKAVKGKGKRRPGRPPKWLPDVRSERPVRKPASREQAPGPAGGHRVG
jgi:hypothetical protein